MAVVIPCHNDGDFLPDALASLEAQEAHELVIVDDGSTDPGTHRLLDDLADAGVRVIRQRNAGVSAARMTGANATLAPYVFPLDADDCLMPGALAAMADALDRDPLSAIAWGDVQRFGTDERLVPASRSLDPWLITHFNGIPAGALIRRTALEATGGWALRDIHEDWDLWLSMAARGFRGTHVGRATLRYRTHAEARRFARMLARHEEILAEFRQRHGSLFAARSRNWRRSDLPLLTRLLVPLAIRAPRCSLRRREELMYLVLTMTLPGLRVRMPGEAAPHPLMTPLRKRMRRALGRLQW